jgi:hypothetical protein
VTNTNPERDPRPPTTPAPPRPNDIGEYPDPTAPGTGTGPFDLSELIAAGNIDVVDGDPPVPISVWRVAGVDHPLRHDPTDGLTPHTAALLVGSYTLPGDTIVSAGGDPALEGAAGRGGRRYRCVADPAQLAGLDHVAGSVRLVVLRWRPRSGRAHHGPHRTGRAPCSQPAAEC